MTTNLAAAANSRRVLLLGAATLALALPAVVHAQAAQPAATAAADPAATEGEEEAAVITVTGSRISRTGYDSPIPVSVVSEAELKAEPVPAI